MTVFTILLQLFFAFQTFEGSKYKDWSLSYFLSPANKEWGKRRARNDTVKSLGLSLDYSFQKNNLLRA